MRRLPALCLVVLVTLLVASCNPASQPQPTDDAAAPADATEPVVVTLAYNRFLQTSFTDYPAPIDVIRTAVAEQHPNIEVQLNIVPDAMGAYRDALAVWISTEDPTIDIYGMDTPWVLEFGEAGWAEPLNEHLPTLEENFFPVGLDLFSYQGQRLGVPFWGSIGGMFYRTDLLEQYGFEPPATYDDLEEIVTTITADQPELTGFVWPGAREEALVQVWAEFFLGFGGEYFDEAGTCTINSPAGIQAVGFMVDTIESGLSPRETPGWNAEEARTRFVSGEAVFLRHNQDIVTWLDDPEQSQVAGNWGFMPNPAQPLGRPTGATGGFAFAINPYTDNLEAAIDVLAVIASEEVQKGFALAWGPVQYYEGLYKDTAVQETNPNVQLIETVLDSAAPRPPSTSYTQLSDIIQEEIHAALTGIKPVEAALNDACSRIDTLHEQ
ncbi:MAG: extracellular solute-binding protein [Chloroflexaceae bacterium]|nr:extracellular solute-binding protein [Chloroflexaceae bacterium]NJO04429.1 extracellular solute-binding protein [Chloroflexaceae bacterium]